MLKETGLLLHEVVGRVGVLSVRPCGDIAELGIEVVSQRLGLLRAMKDKRAYGAILLLGFALVSSADAETNESSANFKLQGCRDFITRGDDRRALVQDIPRLYRAISCAGEVAGIAATLQVMGEICWPQGVTDGQIDAVVVNYMERIPERHHENFTVLTIEALKRAWPCRH
jgi:Rap1a immunity proteins